MLKSQLQHSDLYSLKLQQQAELVNQVNRHQAMWKAQLNPSVGLIHKEILSELIQFTEPTRHNPELRLNVVELFGPGPIYDTDTLPSNFDPSDQWPACRFLRKPTVDQAGCGACGVVSAVSSFTDRFCIATNGSVNNGFSSYNALTCGETANFNKELQSCVAGSSPRLAFQDIVDRGLTTEQCQPWPFRPDCGTPCPPHEFVLNQAAPCNDKCDGSDEKATVYKGKVAYTVTDLSSDPHPNDIQHATALIQRELMERGPVAACFKVFEDFLHYKSGVYVRTTGEQVYLHCVRLIGWGLDQVTGLPYWLAANSWGTEWGENGFFRILRGENQCGIEAEVEAVEI